MNAKSGLLILAVFFLFLAFCVESGSSWLIGPLPHPPSDIPAPLSGPVGHPPGIGVSDLAVLDIALLYSAGLLALDLVAPLRSMVGRVQGVVTFVFSLSALFAALALLFKAIALLTLMVALLLALPFGTLFYLFHWGHFDTKNAAIVLSLAMNLKLTGVVLLILSAPTMLKNKGLMLLLISSIGMTYLLAFLQALPPRILVSITDAIGAIIACCVALFWAAWFLIGSVPAVVKAVTGLVPRA